MQRSIKTTTMAPQNPAQETESNTTTSSPESDKPIFSSENSSGSKNTSKPDDESARESDDAAAAAAARRRPEEEEEEERESMRAATVSPKSDRTVDESSSSSGRERLKRHRVEVAGRVWIPDMWGQEDFLKDWIDCASFDASLVSSSIVLARDSLVEEGRRASSTRLRIQHGC